MTVPSGAQYWHHQCHPHGCRQHRGYHRICQGHQPSGTAHTASNKDIAAVIALRLAAVYIILSFAFNWYKQNFINRITSIINPFYPEYDSSRSYPFYPEYDSSRSLHLTRLPCTLTFWNPIGWLTPNDVSISGSLGNSYFSTNQRRSVGICSSKRVPPS